MERKELLRRLVLNAMCDNYENVDQIVLKDAASRGVRLGLTIESG
jgi:hypothetical protein